MYQSGYLESDIWGEEYTDPHIWTVPEETSPYTCFAIEPVLLLTFENRCFYLSHRKDCRGRREYRLGEFLKRGQYVDKFIPAL
jgi:hypothetical protein